MSRRNIRPYLSNELFDRFKKFAAAAGTSDSSIVEAALTEYLDQSSDRRLLFRRLNRIARAQERHQRDLGIIIETLGAFIFSWLAHTPEIPEPRKDVARKQAARRLTELQEYIARQLTGGHRFIDALVDEPVAEPEDAADELPRRGR